MIGGEEEENGNRFCGNLVKICERSNDHLVDFDEFQWSF